MLTWVLITMLLNFQADHPVERLDVIREVGHSRKERCRIKTYSATWLVNLVYAMFKMTIPLLATRDKWYHNSSIYVTILTTDVIYFGCYLIWFLAISLRVLLTAHFHYKDAYDKHKWSYLGLTIIFISSCVTLFSYNYVQLNA